MDLDQVALKQPDDTVDSYDAYWVYVHDTDAGDRVLLGTQYDPESRDDELGN